jgi:hypothetical protein
MHSNQEISKAQSGKESKSCKVSSKTQGSQREEEAVLEAKEEG